MAKRETVVVVDFGGQYSQLIARRVRDMKVYSELIPCTTSAEKIKEIDPIGIIFTGGPLSTFDETALTIDPEVFNLGIPIFAICYGMQLTAQMNGGKVKTAKVGEYGKVEIEYQDHILFEGVNKKGTVWMSHHDSVDKLGKGFKVIASTKDTEIAAYANDEKKIYGFQFHPEVVHSVQGLDIMKNFLYKVCNAKGEWTMDSFVSDQVSALKEKLKGKKVLLALSGGVDSSVCAALLQKACPEGLICVFVDHGLLRKGEREEVEKVFKEQFKINLITADASKRFLKKLKNKTEPEKKRKVIGREFIKVFEKVRFCIKKESNFFSDLIIYSLGNSFYGWYRQVHYLCTFFQGAIFQPQFKKCLFLFCEVAYRFQVVRFRRCQIPDLQSITPRPVVHRNFLPAVPGIII